jgi:hypothetical protein
MFCAIGYSNLWGKALAGPGALEHLFFFSKSSGMEYNLIYVTCICNINGRFGKYPQDLRLTFMSRFFSVKNRHI